MVVNNSQTEFSDGTRFDDSTVASASAAAASKGGVHTQVFSLRQPTLVGVAVCWGYGGVDRVEGEGKLLFFTTLAHCLSCYRIDS